MPYTTELTEDYMGVLHAGSGTVTGRQILQGCQTFTLLVQNTENFHYKLVDFSAATELQITTEDLQEIVVQDRLIAASRPHVTVVIVVPNEQMRALANEWERLVEELGWSTHVSTTRGEALHWLRDNFIAAPVESQIGPCDPTLTE
jgi:hypothetical protein